ncbi:hypothetical protein B0H11DRAFT_2264340 [Mycena galericulata]|nr:hypothetical protein B0H11DRAFT_2264340 [Mycena galericulata]
MAHRHSRLVDTDTGVDGEDPQQVTGDRGILISDDGARRSEQLHNIAHKKRRIRLEPKQLDDSLAKWIPVNDEGDICGPEVDDISGLSREPGRPSKRKGYASSDDPMSEFSEVQQLFSDEILRRAALGNWTIKQTCAHCEKLVANSADTFIPCYRCTDCGEFLQCRECCLDRHASFPLHILEEWTGRHWKDTTLRSLGFIYQVGHDNSTIHTIRYRFCGCALSDSANNLCQLLCNAWYPATKTDPDTCATFSVLEFFRLLNVSGDVNAHDFISTLERKTDALESSGIRRVPDRYKAFMRMSRQYAFLMHTRRAGRGHDPAGLAATKAGECMVTCWACPYNGRNLPRDWCDVDPKFRLILAIDANFKLKNRIRTNEHHDPSLGPGWGAFVEPKRYRQHLRKYVGEKDISTCIAFAALMQKDTRNTAGFRVSGVGGCVCARHECMRANGLGDLQKGERYANMDWITMSALSGFDLQELTLSYDIACQWEKTLPARMAKLPPDMQLDLDNIRLQCGLPVWHTGAHEKECANKNALSFLEGLGRSDGEGVERLWSFLNECSYHTKDMGIGNRADTIEDKLDSHNFMKNLGCVDILRRKLVVAIAERATQVASFKEINKTIAPEVRVMWQEAIDNFSRDRSSPNPYLLNGPTEADIRLELKKKEALEAQSGTAPLHGTSATAFLAAGLQLEHAQRRMKVETAKTALTADRESNVNEHRVAFMAKLRRFRDLQRVYTPGAIRAILAEEAQRDEDAPPPKAEHIRLYLPSALSADERLNGCQRGLLDMEARLREAQCSDALVDIRAALHAKSHLISFKNENITGQIQSTRSQTLISQVGAHVTAYHHKYSEARRALIVLKGADHAPHFKKLRTTDLTLAAEEKESDATSREKLGRIGAGKQGRAARNGASKNRFLSWIWTARGALDAQEQDLHESLRVEWSRAKARKTRWVEEVELLREEMRRVLRYLEWQAAFWERLAGVAEARGDVSVPTQRGMMAYAAKQAETHRDLFMFYKGQLSLTAAATVGSVLTQTAEDGLADLFNESVSVSVASDAGVAAVASA